MDPAVRLQLVYLIGRVDAAKGHIGRRRLASISGLTEMSVRLELQGLRDADWVTVDRSGIKLTEAGQHRFSSVLNRIRQVREIDLTSLRIDTCMLAGLVAAPTRDSAWTLRDHAVREGATGMLLLEYEAGGWRFTHNDEPIAIHNPEDAVTIQATFPEAGQQDRLILASAPDRRRAGLGLWHVIKTIVGDS